MKHLYGFDLSPFQAINMQLKIAFIFLFSACTSFYVYVWAPKCQGVCIEVQG